MKLKPTTRSMPLKTKAMQNSLSMKSLARSERFERPALRFVV
jgi:hypothetical protein